MAIGRRPLACGTTVRAGTLMHDEGTRREGLEFTWRGEMISLSLLKHPSAFLPVSMSVAALATVLSFLALHGPAPQPDEGAAAHIWQLLMAGQVPIVLFFAIQWVPRSPRQALPVLALQIGAALAAMAPVFLLHW
jgi:hypothetical protein